MKKILFVLLTAVMMFGGLEVSAQGKYGADSANCIKYLSYYKEYYKAKNYEDAVPNWRKAFKTCPNTANQTMIIDGTALMRYLINKNRNNDVVKAGLVDTLMQLHTIRATCFPKYAVTAYNNKGLDMINYIQDDPKALYSGCKEIIDFNGDQTKAQIFLFSLNSGVELYQRGLLLAEDILDDYETASKYLDQIIASAANTADKANAEKIKNDIDNIFGSANVASCDKLVELYTPKYEADPENIELLGKIVKMMSKAEDCTDNDLFFNAVTTMYKADPSYNSAYFVYRLNSSRGNVDDAIRYLEEAIAFDESDAAQDAQYYYELAVFASKSGNKYSAKAVDSALKAAALDGSYAGKSYMLCGTIWGSQSCGTDYISKRAPYWVAVDFLTKAAAADESLAESANALIRQYRTYFPEAAEAFMYDVTNGQSYTVSCNGLKATTTVRTQK